MIMNKAKIWMCVALLHCFFSLVGEERTTKQEPPSGPISPIEEGLFFEEEAEFEECELDEPYEEELLAALI